MPTSKQSFDARAVALRPAERAQVAHDAAAAGRAVVAEGSTINVKSESGINEVEFKTKGSSDIWVVHNTIAPSGHTGWHSHPGPSIISVKSGTATEYHGEDPNTPIMHAAGTSFVDDGEGAHIVRNEGDTNLELVAFQILPSGATRRIDQPQP